MISMGMLHNICSPYWSASWPALGGYRRSVARQNRLSRRGSFEFIRPLRVDSRARDDHHGSGLRANSSTQTTMYPVRVTTDGERAVEVVVVSGLDAQTEVETGVNCRKTWQQGHYCSGGVLGTGPLAVRLLQGRGRGVDAVDGAYDPVAGREPGPQSVTVGVRVDKSRKSNTRRNRFSASHLPLDTACPSFAISSLTAPPPCAVHNIFSC